MQSGNYHTRVPWKSVTIEVFAAHTHTTHSPHTHTHREWQSCVLEWGAVGRGYVIKYANNCKMKMCMQSQTKRNAQSISNTFWLALSINNTLQAHTTSNSSNSNNNKERRYQGATLALRVEGGRGWWHQFICATHANANKLNCKSWLAASQLAPLVPLSPSPIQNSIKQEQQKWAIRTEPCTSTSI